MYLMGSDWQDGQPPPGSDAGALSLRAAWDRNSVARKAAGLPPYTTAEIENLLRTRKGPVSNWTTATEAKAIADLVGWLDAETSSLMHRTATPSSGNGGGGWVLPVVVLGLLFLLKR